MSFEIGPISRRSVPGGLPPVRRTARAGFEAMPSTATTPAGGARAAVPAVVRDAVGVAADRAETLAGAGRELHFQPDRDTGRVVVQVRELATGKVIRTIPPSDALAFLAGGA